ncbi:hypothetical protein ACFZCG_39300 [Streptomyces tanashiensis]|uniref:hypothetical protein n=1 Tax=Streptomyces tanashiensis TaxID=67367 RepID=UPI0036E20D10
MDAEQITEELYRLTPSEFTTARDAYVAEARKAKDPKATKVIAALRRPALAAWAANLLARQQPEETQQFLTLGETLREAHRSLDSEVIWLPWRGSWRISLDGGGKSRMHHRPQTVTSITQCTRATAESYQFLQVKAHPHA